MPLASSPPVARPGRVGCLFRSAARLAQAVHHPRAERGRGHRPINNATITATTISMLLSPLPCYQNFITDTRRRFGRHRRQMIRRCRRLECRCNLRRIIRRWSLHCTPEPTPVLTLILLHVSAVASAAHRYHLAPLSCRVPPSTGAEPHRNQAPSRRRRRGCVPLA